MTEFTSVFRQFLLEWLADVEFQVWMDADYFTVRVERRPVANSFKVLDENGKEVTNMASIVIGDGKKRTLTIDPNSIVHTYPDGSTKPAKVDGKFDYNIVPSGKVGVFPSSDGFSVELTNISGSDPNVSVLTISVDVDLGPNVKTITKALDILTQFPEATDFGVAVGPEQDV